MPEMKPLVTIVTGASRGIGTAIVELLASSRTPVKIYAVSRAGTDLGIKATPPNSITYEHLDVADPAKIERFVERVKKEDGQLDRLINNAGVNVDYEKGQSGEEKAETTIDINYRGTRNMCLAFLPLMTEQTGRIVNLSSVASHLRGYSKENEQRFRSCQTLEDVDAIAADYLKTAEKGDAKQQGWSSPYCVSKALVNALTAVLAKQAESRGVLVNCCCPGWVDTDMGGILGNPPKSLEDGAKIPVRLALGEIGNTSGRFWEEPSISSTGEGRVSEW